MTRGELIEAIARAIAERGPRSLYGDAVAALSAIEAAGVRLVPVEATKPMTAAYWSAAYWSRGGDGLSASEAWDVMLAASPYAPAQKDESND